MKNFLLSKLIFTTFFGLLGCTVLQPVSPPELTTYTLEAPLTRLNVRLPGSDKSILLGNIRADAELGSKHILYRKKAFQIDVYQQSQWQQSPALMLFPVVTRALEHSGLFELVLKTPTPIIADYRLDLNITSLQQEFTSHPSQVRFGLHAYLSENKTSVILGAKEFEAVVASPSEDAYGAVIASNIAVAQVLQQLTEFCRLQMSMNK
ncbi:ABC-type transport auxiliary lipoprotein family protein [Undibacterium sp. SXout20W]|uniref:ABC-type transport auxiliary lipoprotein family protein n=1 Tax=Undibacterium sp. SXout20W TaxID=3413051 RepID=UPI003BF0C459